MSMPGSCGTLLGVAPGLTALGLTALGLTALGLTALGWMALTAAKCRATNELVKSSRGCVIFSGCTGVGANDGLATGTRRPVTVIAHTTFGCERACWAVPAMAEVPPSDSVPPAGASVAAMATARRCSAALRGRPGSDTGSLHQGLQRK